MASFNRSLSYPHSQPFPDDPAFRLSTVDMAITRALISALLLSLENGF